MACDLPTVRTAYCTSGIGKLDNELELLRVIAQLSCELSSAAAGNEPGLPFNSVQFNNAGAFGGSADLTFNDTTNVLALTGSQTIAVAANTAPFAVTGYSLTAANAQNGLSLAGTWNTTGNPTGIRLSIVNTASGSGARLMNLLAGAAGATSRFSVDVAGNVDADNSIVVSATANEVSIGFYRNGVSLSSTGMFTFGTGAAASGVDVAFARNAAGIVEVNSGVAGTFRTLQAILKTSVNATAAAPPVTTHTIPITDAAGVVYRVPCLV